MKSILRKGLPLSTFAVVVVFHFIGLRTWACSTCVDNGVWHSCGDTGYMWLITTLYAYITQTLYFCKLRLNDTWSVLSIMINLFLVLYYSELIRNRSRLSQKMRRSVRICWGGVLNLLSRK